MFALIASGAVTSVAAIVSPVEPLGPSSRHTGLVISEIMYRPLARADFRNLEFIEIFNSNPFPEDLSGYRLSADADFNFAPGTILPGRAFLVVAGSPGDIQAIYGITNVVGPFSGNLPSNSGRIRLRNPDDIVLLDVEYDGDPPWPVAADGGGHSLVLARPSFGEGTPQAWAASDSVGGSPGKFEPATNDPLRAIVINEVLANVEAPNLDYVEFFNRGTQLLDISGCVLTDDPDVPKFTFPTGTTILPGGFLAIDEFLLGFSLGANGEKIYFSNPTRTRVLDSVRFPALALNASFGRFPDGGGTFRPLAANTPWAPNSSPYRSEIIINEIMYAPISGQSDDEYVEIYNRGTNAVALGGWRFTDGIEFTIPAGVTLPAGEFLAIAKNAAWLMTRYTNLTAQNTFGDFSGGLARGGERLTLVKPEVSFATNNLGTVSSNVLYVLADEITYRAGGRHAPWANGAGSSLELIDPRADSGLAANWQDSDESAKAPWTTWTATGVLENGPVSGEGSVIRNVQFVLLGAGECLLDDVEVLPAGGGNRVLNSTFESGLSGWFSQGNHSRSDLSLEGFNSTRSLRLRASSRGDTGPNRILAQLTTPLSAGQTVTLRAKVRWLRGAPEIVMRLHGNWLEAAARLSLPDNLGTPGLRNSRFVSNAPPAIFEVQHHPVLPTNQQPVVVTARIQDVDGLSSVALHYRVDAPGNAEVVPMTDSGSNGDLLAGDGIYSAVIPGKPPGTVVAFHVRASDNFQPGATTFFPENAPARECLIRFGEPMETNRFGTYRLWLSQESINRWVQGPVLGREPIDATFVYGNERVIYNVGARYAATPYVRNFTSPVGQACNYFIEMPLDDPFLGTAAGVELHAPGNSAFDDTTLQVEQTAYWMAGKLGLPQNYRRYVNVFVNGLRRGTLMEDTESPTLEATSRWFENEGEGKLFKAEPWLEFDDPGANFANHSWATLNNYAPAAGVQNPGRYRWNFPLPAANGSANDYRDIFNLVTLANVSASGGYTAGMEANVDIEQWVRTLALQHALGNWDSFGHRNSENTYLYKPGAGKWKLAISDFNIALGNAGSDGPSGDDLLQHLTSDAGMARFYGTPAFQRAYWRALKAIAEGPLQSANVNPILDARFAAFTANGVAALSPDTTRANGWSLKSWITARRNYILTRLSLLSAPFTISGPASFTTANNLVTLSGTAPIEAASILVNGTVYYINWLTLTNWSISVVVNPGTTPLNVLAYDRAGVPLFGMTGSVSVTYSGAAPLPQNQIVINEIMFHPFLPGAEYLEIFNTSHTHAYDLSFWRINGLEYTFPPGTLITNGQFIVLAKDRSAFANAYGVTRPVQDVYPGNLRKSGETLTLVMPGNSVADKILYEAAAPWPGTTNGFSYQLKDANEDNSRVANWLGNPPTPGTANQVTTNAAPFPSLWLNEVHANQPGGLADNAGDPDPWIELYNSGSSPIALEGFSLANNYTNLTQWNFPPLSIGPGQFLRVWVDGEAGESLQNSVHTNFRLNAPRGSIALSQTINGQTRLIDYLNYDGLVSAFAYGAFGDGQPFYRTVLRAATPNAPNAPPPILINEWMASNTTNVVDPADGIFEDWFELFNAGPAPVDLSGLYVSDRPTNPTASVIPEETRILPGGFLLIWADDQPDQNDPEQNRLHANFSLSRDGETIGLATPDGRWIDQVTFRRQTPDLAEGRYSDGALLITPLRTATPGASNSFPYSNSPPHIAPIPDQIVGAGQTVSFSVMATDAETPPQMLNFGFATPPPQGTFMDPASGAFIWTPDPSQIPSTNVFTVRVADNGTPPLSATRSFTIIAGASLPPQIDVAQGSNGMISLRWTTVAGRTYRVEYKDDLNAPAWTPIGGAVAGNGSPSVLSAATQSPAQRFYRVVETE